VSGRLRWRPRGTRDSLTWTSPATRLRLTPNAPVTIVRSTRPTRRFSYTDEQWVRVVSARDNAIWSPRSNLSRMRAKLETAGRRYRAVATRDLRCALKQARALVTLGRALRFSKVEIDTLRAAASVFDSMLAGPNPHHAARRTLVREAADAWLSAAGDTKVSHTGPAMRSLEAALLPILGEKAMVGAETLYQAVRQARRRT
jgi:hypothetical protein